MQKTKAKKIKLILIIFLFIYFQTIVYSAFSSTMNVTGTAHARIEKDVRITDFKLISTKGASTFYEQFSIDTLSAGINILSNESEREIIYEVEVTNYGSTDIGILNITGMPNNLSYELIDYKLQDKICDESNKCNNFAVKTFQIKITGNPGDYEFTLKFDFRTYHKVTYTDIENKGYPTDVIDGGDLNITFKEELKRILIISNNVEIAYYNKILNNQTITINNINNDIQIQMKEQVAKLVSGFINKVGSEVCIKEECFYIIDNNGETVTMLAKYNLYVGSKCTGISVCTAYGTSATGLQDSTMQGKPSGAGWPRNGSLTFSTTNYWSSTVSSYPAYVYNSNTFTYPDIENYKTYLESQEVEIKNARLVNYEELKKIGCSDSSCTNAQPWVYTTTYWTGTASSSSNIWRVNSNGDFNVKAYTDMDSCGLRPVIEISKDEIKPLPLISVISGNIDTIGSEIVIDGEQFYVISSDSENVTMLAKYNLYVGGRCTGNSTCTEYGEEATGLQDSRMPGKPSAGGWPRNGTIGFSTSSYWSSTVSTYPAYVYDSNSVVYNHIENYKTYLEDKGVIEVRLIKQEELKALGCSNSSCTTAPSWVYETSYWTGTANASTSLWRVSANGEFNTLEYSDIDSCGVRPVITMPKSYFKT